MNERNPYLAPQAGLTAQAIPMANATLPRQMLVVADGMKLLLWGILLSIGGYLLALLLGMYAYDATVGQGVQGRAQPAVPDMRQVELRLKAASNGLKTRVIVYGVVGIIGNIVSLVGMYKCLQIPLESGARRTARWAFSGGVALILFGLTINLIKLTRNSVNFVTMLELGYVILSYITLRILLRFLQHTANYTGDPSAIGQSKLLVKIVLVIFGIVAGIVSLGLVILLANIAGQIKLSLGMLSMILIIAGICCSIWAIFLYIRMLRRLKAVITISTM